MDGLYMCLLQGQSQEEEEEEGVMGMEWVLLKMTGQWAVVCCSHTHVFTFVPGSIFQASLVILGC